MQKSMEEMSGESKSSPRLTLNELVYNGKKNKFFLVMKKAGLIEQEDGKKKFDKQELGEEVNVIFLRIRRKLRQYRKDEKPLTTNEHNTKADMLTLFGDTEVIKGSNDELKARHQLLRTVQIVYALYLPQGSTRGELVRLIVKGSALGSKVKAKDVHDFYSYISSFKAGGADEHFYEHITILKGVEEQGELGEYYAMTFVQGEKITDNEEMMSEVKVNMTIAYDYITASDEYYKSKNAAEINKEIVEQKAADIDTIEYPDDDVDLEDIPF